MEGENRADYLVKIVLASFWVVDGGLITVMSEMAGGNEAVTP